MNVPVVLAFVIVLAGVTGAALTGPTLSRLWHRQRIARRPFPATWRKIARRRVPLARELPAAQQVRLKKHIQVLLAEVPFVGCAARSSSPGTQFEKERPIRTTVPMSSCTSSRTSLIRITGAANAAPYVGRGAPQQAWARVMNQEFDALRARLARAEPSLIEPDAATSPAEFFAVTTELFFERPDALAAERPALYEQLKRCYRLNPLSW